MSKALRLSEKWFQRGLWLVALVFACFLIGLGGKVVQNLQMVETEVSMEQFIDHAQALSLRAAEQAEGKRVAEASERLDQARQKHGVAVANTRAARETFENWLATRHVTARPEQDADLIARTKELDALRATERSALALSQAQEQAMLDATQSKHQAEEKLRELEKPARIALAKAERAQELRIFGYRLALTLPLLLIAAWLYVKQRKSQYWPFVWGFIFFAVFAFFVELVPYLPSYGGYVRYLVGIVGTVVIGRQAIVSLQRYLARQRAAEALPDAQRRKTLSYDVAYTRLSKSVCPGCERSVDLKNPAIDFCPHCGISLFDHCGKCDARKGSFAGFCHACGTPAAAEVQP